MSENFVGFAAAGTVVGSFGGSLAPVPVIECGSIALKRVRLATRSSARRDGQIITERRGVVLAVERG